MATDLRDRIRRALRDRLDGEVFEQCAVELLKPRYAKLQWVPGSNDAGQDGIGETADGTPFILVVTTQQRYAANLRKSLRSYQAAGRDLRAVVLATSRRVSGRMRKTLPQEIRAEFEFDLIEIHSQEEFVDLLHDNPVVRRKLLPGVGAPVTALTRNFHRVHADLSLGLIGRDVERDELLASAGDIIVVGVPGVGKSYLLEHLCKEHDWAWLDVGRDRSISELSDDILEKKPARVIVDDAHFDIERLSALDQLRRDIDIPFHIVACCWPTRLDDMRTKMPQARVVMVPELTLAHIRDIVVAAGVHGPRDLHAAILDQARGRAGLAVLLARACADNRVVEAFGGDLLARHTLEVLQRALKHNPRYELAVLALTGQHGASVETVSTVLGKDVGSVADALRTVASSGTIDEAPRWRDSLVVQPEPLRYALVRDVFFNRPVSLDVRSVLAKLPEPAAAAIPLIVAALRGSPVDRRLIYDVIDWADRSSVIAYAQLGQQELRMATQQAPQHLIEIARETLQNQGVSDTVVRTLLDAAVDDDRVEDLTETHPLRVLSDFFKQSRCGIGQRESAMRAAETWADKGGPPEYAARVILSALYPGVDESELDLVSPNTLKIYHDPFLPATVQKLTSLWDIALDFLRRHASAPPKVILDGLQHWLYPGLVARNNHEDAEAVAAIRTVGLRIADELATIYADRPIALRSLARRANRVGASIAVPEQSPVAAFYRDDDLSDDVHVIPPPLTDAEERRLADVVTGYAMRNVEEIVDLIAEIEREAKAVGVGLPPLLPHFAKRTANAITDPVAFAQALVDRNCASSTIMPVIHLVVERQCNGHWNLVKAVFRHPVYRGMVLYTMCSEGAPADIRAMLIAEYDQRDVWEITRCALEGRFSSEELTVMLDDARHPMASRLAVHILVAARLNAESEQEPPPSVQKHCREVVARYRLPLYGEDSEDVGVFGEVLRRDHELFREWLEGWLVRMEDEDREWLPYHLREMVSRLPIVIRIDLIERIPAHLRSTELSEFVSKLVAGAPSVARTLFARRDLVHLHSDALPVEIPDKEWLEIALAALDVGYTVDAVARASNFQNGFMMWGGSVSIQARIDQFNALRDLLASDQRDVGEQMLNACVALHERHLEKERDREHVEKVFGRLSYE